MSYGRFHRRAKSFGNFQAIQKSAYMRRGRHYGYPSIPDINTDPDLLDPEVKNKKAIIFTHNGKLYYRPGLIVLTILGVFGLVLLIGLVIIPAINREIFRHNEYKKFNAMVKKEVLPLSRFATGYDLEGDDGSVLFLTLSDDFDRLSTKEQWLELKKLVDVYSDRRRPFNVELKLYYYGITSSYEWSRSDLIERIEAQTSKNRYRFISIYDTLSINGQEHQSEEFEP